MGLRGKLSAAQIVEQLVAARRVQAAERDAVPITNIVFMVRGAARRRGGHFFSVA